MKKITIAIVMAVLCPIFRVSAQEPLPTGGLKIGDQVPDVTINGIINYKSADGKPINTVKISDFKGKLLILDFWATWCSPCVAMIPKMDSLQRDFEGRVQFLPITYQSRKEVQVFMEKLQKQQHTTYNLPDVVADTTLKKLFPHVYLPHYVWINRDGIVLAITEFTEVSRKNIQNSIQNETLNVKEKKDEVQESFDVKKPFFVAGNGGTGQNLLYRSILTGYTEGIGMGYLVLPTEAGGRRIAIRNLNIEWLFQIAFSDGHNHFNESNTILDVKDKDLLNTNKVGAECDDWLRQGNGFCYELIVPAQMKSASFKIMQEELSRYFVQYNVVVENRNIHCLKLIRISGQEKLQTTGGKTSITFDRFGWNVKNATIGAIIERLNVLQSSALPILDDTGYKGKVDITIAANLPDIAKVNDELKKYDLKIVETEKDIPTLIIKDRQ